MQFGELIRKVVRRLVPSKDMKEALGFQPAVSGTMDNAISDWIDMYMNQPPWRKGDVKCLNLPAAVCSEMARLVMTEFQYSVSGSPRADYIAESFRKKLVHGLRRKLEYGLAGGTFVIKPYYNGTGLEADFVRADRAHPLSFNDDGEVTKIAFDDFEMVGDTRYTRFEVHTYSPDGTYTVENFAFKQKHYAGVTAFGSGDGGVDRLGTPCSLKEVKRWENLEAKTSLENIPCPLFAFGRNPAANNIDPDSVMGMSVFGKAVDQIRDCDEQWARIQWEYKSKETALQVSKRALNKDRKGNPILDEHEKRLFEIFNFDMEDGKLADFIREWSPDIRDSSLFNGLNKMLQRVEFNCGLAYGTLSDPQIVDKTAEEIRSAKQRSYSVVCDLQEEVQRCLDLTVQIMDVYCTLYGLAPEGNVETSFSWGDGILEDADKEFTRRKQMADSGYINKIELVKYYFGVTEEDARALMPAAALSGEPPDERDPFRDTE